VKLYKVLKDVSGHKPGDILELDPAHFATQHLEGQGLIAEALGVEDELLVRAIEMVAEGVSKSIESATTKALEVVAASANKGPRIDAGESEDDRRKSFGHQLVQIAKTADTDIPAEERARAHEILTKIYKSTWNQWHSKAALAEGAGVQGGYGVFPEFSSELLRIAIEEAALASRARIIPMAAAEIHIPALDQTTAPGTAGQTAYTGGMVAYWTAEAATRTETEPKFKQVTLRANELSGYSLASRTLLADNGIGLEALLGDLIRETVSWYLDYGCLQGPGVTQPLGVLNAGATVKVSRQTANKFQLQDAAKMLGSLLPRSRKTSVWLISPDVYQQLLQLADSSGRVVWLPNFPGGGNLGPAQPAPDNNLMLFGLPVVVTEKLPALGTTGDVTLVDPRYYLVGQRQQIEIAASEHYKFINNQMTWRFVARLDGQPWMDKPLTLQDTSRTLSPYVVLN
jgi:HK97 family phage major capsid protein